MKPAPVTKKKLPQHYLRKLRLLKKLFWDYNFESVKKNLDSPFVIGRILEMGNSEQFKILSELIGDEKIVCFLKTKGENLLSKQSLNFWKLHYEKKFREKT